MRDINHRSGKWCQEEEVDFIKNMGSWCCKTGVCDQKRKKLLEGYIEGLKNRKDIEGLKRKRLIHIAKLEINKIG